MLIYYFKQWCSLYVYLTTTLYYLKKIYVNGYSFISEEAIQINIIVMRASKSDSNRKWCELRHYIRSKSTSRVCLVDFEQANVCWDVIKSLLSFGLFLKCYTANVVHAHLISIGKMLWCTHFSIKMQVILLRITY